MLTMLVEGPVLPQSAKRGLAKRKATPWQPKITEPVWPSRDADTLPGQMLSQHESSPNFRNCAGGGEAHWESCRLRFEKISDKEEARERRLLKESARLRAMPAPQHANHQRASPRRPHQRRVQRPLHQQPMDIAKPAAEPGRDLDVHLADRQSKRRRELEDVEMTAILAQPVTGRTHEI